MNARGLKVWGWALLAFVMTMSDECFAQAVSRGGALKKVEYQTYAAMTLYADSALGNDNNACTSSGAGACASISGAIAKVPKVVRHLVTINVAAGTYGAFGVKGFKFDDADSTGTMPTAGINITGSTSYTTFAPATGTATGTVSSTTSSGRCTITDSTQTWTTDNLRDNFVSWGSTRLPIQSNTATTLYVPCATMPSNGTAYTINYPSSRVVGTTSPLANIIQPVEMRGVSQCALSHLDFEYTNSATPTYSIVSIYLGNASISDSRVRMTNASAVIGSTGILGQAGGTGTFNVARVVVSIASTASASTALTTNNFSGTTTATASYFRAGGNAVRTRTLFSSSGSVFETMNTASITAALSSYLGNFSLTTWPSVVLCAVGSTQSALAIGTSGGTAGDDTGYQLAGAVIGATGIPLNVYNCARGLDLTGSVQGALQLNLSDVATGIRLRRGARVNSLTGTFTNVTNALDLDGTTYQLADLDALSPATITSPYGSSVSR